MHVDSTSPTERDIAAIGAVLLLLPLFFVLHMTATYNVGLSYPLQSVINAAFESGMFQIAGTFLLLGAPLLAVALNLLVVFRISFERREGELVSMIRVRPLGWNLAIISVTGLLYAAFATYLLAENWQCLIGSSTAC